ncbi:MAG TPA: hypothetical protein VLV54_10045 [Thermoanaerobaculia bacterium]|nr:hypothetical protein [Thermoanaerobaculia bacterium]
MKIQNFKTALFAVALLVSGALQAQSHTDQFVGTIANMEGGSTAPVVIHIDHYSSDQEVANLKGILAEKGPDALRDALWDLEAGYIRVQGGLGYPIAVARSKPEADGGRVIRLMIDRPISFREAANNLRSVDYPFSYIEIHLDASGKGEGKLIAAAKVTLTGSTVEIESLGVQPFKLLDVHSR